VAERRQWPSGAPSTTAAEHLRERFIANVSHDLRAPLAVIKSSLGVVLANEPAGMPEPLHRLLTHADAAADRLTHLVNDLITLTRLQTGNLPLVRTRCDLNTIARRAARRVAPQAQARGQQLSLDLPRRAVRAPADAAWLDQVVFSLLGNAQRFGRPGGRIGVRVRRVGGNVVLAVTDDGPGIREEDHERIFEPFRGEMDHADATGGAPDAGAAGVSARARGLSLAIARAIVQWHQGRLWVESAPGAGATFFVSLPVAPPLPPQLVS
jgi:signal transduction histidine kinase